MLGPDDEEVNHVKVRGESIVAGSRVNRREVRNSLAGCPGALSLEVGVPGRQS